MGEHRARRVVANQAFGKFLGSTLLVIAVSNQPAHASQAITTNTSADANVEEIVVTGSRIKRRDLSSTSPMVTIDRSLIDFSPLPSITNDEIGLFFGFQTNAL